MSSTRRPRPSDAETIEATAAAWLAQRDDGLTTAEAADFARWRNADVRHEAAVARLEAAWAALAPLRDFRPDARAHPDPDLLAARPRRRVVPFRAVAVAALAASLVVAAAGWFVHARLAARDGIVYATPADGYGRMTLRDGSVLELNASSEARVRFTERERRVELRRGEAHFTVAKNPSRPFWVEAGTVAVRAVGTAFNVRLGDEHVEVLVTEGTVGVERIGPNVLSSAGPPEPARRGEAVAPEVTPLVASQRAVISAAGGNPPAVEQLEPAAIREALAWQSPRLTFADTPLAVVVTQFNRRNAIQLVIADPELETVPIGGSFRAENVDAFVRLLAQDNEVIVDRSVPDRIVLRRRK